MTNILTNQYWAYGQSPDIRFDFKYDMKRIGSGAYYKFYWTFHSLNTPQSGFGWPIYATVQLDGVTKLNGIMLKGTNPIKWFDSNTVKYESAWVSVPNKMTGTTSYRMTMFSGMGMDRTQAWNGTLDVPDLSTTAEASDFVLGSRLDVTMNRAYDTYTATVELRVGSYRATKTGVTASTYFDTDIAWSDAYQNDSQGIASLYVTTYDGSTVIGSTYTVINAIVPESVKPSANVVLEALGGFNNQFLLNKSRAKITVNPSGSYGSSITGQMILFGNESSEEEEFTFSTVSEVGSIPWSVTVTDSRGRTNTYSGTVNVIDYTEPTISAVQPYRCLSNGTFSSSGTYAYCEATATYDQTVEGNTVEIRAYYMPLDGYYQQDGTIQNGVGQAKFAGNILLNKSYKIKLVAVDAVGNEATYEGKITSSNNFMMSAVKGKVAFGKYVDPSLSDGIQVEGDIHLTGELKGNALSLSPAAMSTSVELYSGSLRNNAEISVDVADYPIIVIYDLTTNHAESSYGWHSNILFKGMLSLTYQFFVGEQAGYPYKVKLDGNTLYLQRVGTSQVSYRIVGVK